MKPIEVKVVLLLLGFKEIESAVTNDGWCVERFPKEFVIYFEDLNYYSYSTAEMYNFKQYSVEDITKLLEIL